MGRKEEGATGIPSNAMLPGPRSTSLRLHPSSRLSTIDMGKNWVGRCAFFWGYSWVPIEHKVAWAEAYIHTKRHRSPLSRLAKKDTGQKLGGCTPLGEGELGPHPTQCGVGRGYLRTKWHIDPCSRLATIDVNRKLGLTQSRLG